MNGKLQGMELGEVIIDEWGVDEAPKTERTVTIEELDNAVKAVIAARKVEEDTKKVYNEASKQTEIAEFALMELLGNAGKSSYKLDGIASISMYDKFEIKNPNDPEEKQKFFKWVEEQFGQDGLNKYQVTNYASINSLYNEWAEQCKETGADPAIPGLGLPTARKVLRVTKAK